METAFQMQNVAGVAALEAGRGAPLVLLHGIGSRAFSWATQLERWSRHAHVLAWDAPGYGESLDLPGTPSVEAYAGALVRRLDAARLERPLIVGHSLGALIAAAFAARYPDRVAGLVLLSVACGYGALPPAERERRYEARACELTALGPEAFSAARAAVLISPGGPPEAVERVRAAMRTIRLPGYLAALRTLMSSDVFAYAPAIVAPALVACGSADTVTPPEQTRRVAERIAGATFALVEGAGHAVYVERPDALDEVVVPFFKAHRSATR